MKITQSVEVILDNEKYVLEEGDEIIVNEGLISRALLAALNKIIPLNLINDLDPKFQSMFANLAQDPEKASMLQNLFKKEPDFLKIFT